jgi:hypothetical protein
VLASAVGRLQRDAPLAKRGSDLDDDTVVARPHPGQRRHGAVYEPKIGHLGHTPEFLGRGLGERGEHRGERRVDPHVDRAEGVLDLLGGVIDLGEVRHVRGNGEPHPPACSTSRTAPARPA